LADWLLNELGIHDSPVALPELDDLHAWNMRLKDSRLKAWASFKGRLSHKTWEYLTAHQSASSIPPDRVTTLTKDLKNALAGSCLYDANYAHINLRAETQRLLDQKPSQGDDLERLNRMLLEDAYLQLVMGRDAKHPGEEELNTLISVCNSLVFGKKIPPVTAVEKTTLLNEEVRDRLLNNLRNPKSAKKDNKVHHSEAFLNRHTVNLVLERLPGLPTGAGKAAYWSRQISVIAYRRWTRLPWLFWLTSFLVGVPLARLAIWAWLDTFVVRSGEPFNFAGTSTWPAEFIRYGVLALSIFVIIKTQRTLTRCALNVTRNYRLDLPVTKGWSLWPSEPPVTEGVIDANELWDEYRRTGGWPMRLLRVVLGVVIYGCFGFALSGMTDLPITPLRGDKLLFWDFWLLLLAVMAFLFVTLWIVDTALLCAWFIRRLSLAPTRYPRATLDHFAQQRSVDDAELLEEWIDMQMIADLTEPVGRLVYWPFMAVFLMLGARNPWWDHWTWHWPLLVIFAINIGLAAAGSIILQQAARKARVAGVQHFEAKVNMKRRESAASVAEHESDQAERLLDEINNLRRGAFVPISKNPLVGALLVNSSGVVLIEVLALIFSK